jgi:membrane protein DedA with SNARE-associated domain
VDFVREFADALLAFSRDHLYAALVLLLFIEEAGIPLPVPGDTIILLAGAEVSNGQASAPTVVSLVVAATMCGSSILYWVSRLGGMTVLGRLCRFAHIREERVESVGRWLRRHTGPVIVFGRLTPGFRTITSIAAGTFGISYLPFLVYTTISATIWAILYLTLGAAISDFYRTVAAYLFRPSPLALGLLAFALSAAGAAIWQWRRSSGRLPRPAPDKRADGRQAPAGE